MLCHIWNFISRHVVCHDYHGIPTFKSMAIDEKIFKAAAFMLFGDELVAKATDRVEKLKATYSLNVHQARAQKTAINFSANTPKTTLLMAAEGEVEKA